MSPKPYQAYKCSGVAWLGAVPESWAISPLGHFFIERSQTVSDKNFMPLSVTMQGIVPQLENVAKTENGDNRKLVRRGDFVINSRSDRKGSSGVADRDGSVSVISIVLQPRSISSRFVHHLLRSMPFQEEFYRFGSGIVADLWSTRFSSMKSIRLAVPTLSEQNTIADYLDRETAEIDAFIADQEELIALLVERRAATITQAVTKGLDPYVPMKNSGVESLGEVPAHWVVGPVKRFFKSLDSRRIPLSSEERSYKQGLFPYYGASGVIDSLDEFLFDETLVLLSEDGANLKMRSRPIAFVATGKYWVNNHAHILRPANQAFYFWAERLESLDVSPWVTGAAQPKLTIEAAMNLMISCPSDLTECMQIQTYIVKEMSQIDATITDAKEAIVLSKERRAALISAAVTGKIDLRDAIEVKHQMLKGESVGAA